MNKTLREKRLGDFSKFRIVEGDITIEDVDAIVNTANGHLKHGGGVAGVISRSGGSVIQQEFDAWVRKNGPVGHEEPGITTGGNLPCIFIIHAVGPVWGTGDEVCNLISAVRGSLLAAETLGLQSISNPAKSTGIFSFPKEKAAGDIFQTVEEFIITKPHSGINLIRITLYDRPTKVAFLKIWDSLES